MLATAVARVRVVRHLQVTFEVRIDVVVAPRRHGGIVFAPMQFMRFSEYVIGRVVTRNAAALNARGRLRNQFGPVEAFGRTRHVVAQTRAAIRIKVGVQDAVQIDLSLHIAPRRHEGILVRAVVQSVVGMNIAMRKHVGIAQRRVVAGARYNNRTKEKKQPNKRQDELCHGSVYSDCNKRRHEVSSMGCDDDAKLRVVLWGNRIFLDLLGG
jgi:hypothetical protein